MGPEYTRKSDKKTRNHEVVKCSYCGREFWYAEALATPAERDNSVVGKLRKVIM